MKTLAQQALDKEIKTIITANNYEVVKKSFVKLMNLADILDASGDEKNADRVDEIVKEAASIWDFLLGGGASAITTKTPEGYSIIDAIREGKIEKFFSKDMLVRLLTKFFLGGGVSLIAAELVNVVTQKFPILSWFKDSTFIKMAIEGALTYAIMNSNFVSILVDGIVYKIEELLGMKIPKKPSIPTTAQPMPSEPQKTETKPEESDKAQFQIAGA